MLLGGNQKPVVAVSRTDLNSILSSTAARKIQMEPVSQ